MSQKREKHAQKKKEDFHPQLEDCLEKTSRLEAEKNEIFSKLQRVSADYANYQKRMDRHMAEAVGYEKEKLIKSLLPVMDNLEHTLNNSLHTTDTQALTAAVKIIYDQMLSILKACGAEQIRALGRLFDPALHAAMMQRSDGQQEAGIVLEEFQIGYKLDGRVIRPSKVIVNKPAEEPQDSQDQPESDAQSHPEQ